MWGRALTDVPRRDAQVLRAPAYVSTREEPVNTGLVKTKTAIRTSLFTLRSDREARKRVEEGEAARRAIEKCLHENLERKVVKALVAFDKQRRDVYDKLKETVRLCEDPSVLNMQRREAFAELVELLGPPVLDRVLPRRASEESASSVIILPRRAPRPRPQVPAVTVGVPRPAILGIQRAVIDAVEAVAEWQEFNRPAAESLAPPPAPAPAATVASLGFKLAEAQVAAGVQSFGALGLF